ncbi:uncharacterized protein LOC114298585 isoform X2 [Camellia sinensis]|uniref:uncharacterized protein LOC114298585 isoform X2 n=1 Tax=Camellia sinensis TaxID=4442 RepID=UPI001035E847|nr:uncharacterized protein LOC114298585 isoform X2 [Camellia sinensis]
MSRLYEMVKEGIEEHPLIHRPFAIAASWAAWVCGVNRRNPEELVTDRWGLPSGICRFHMTCHSKDQIRGGWDSKCRYVLARYELLLLFCFSNVCKKIISTPCICRVFDFKYAAAICTFLYTLGKEHPMIFPITCLA